MIKDKQPKRVLILTYTFPPMIAAGAYRMAAFAKYLPQFGFHPIVLTVKLNSLSWNGPIDDDSSKGNYPVYRISGAHVGVIATRIFGKHISGYGKSRQEFRSSQASIVKRILGFIYDDVISLQDQQWPWYILGKYQAIKIAKRVKPHILLSSALPFSSHLLAAAIKRKLNIPWVADYRDLWSGFPLGSEVRLTRLWKEKFEKNVLRHSDALATVSKPLAKYLAQISKKSIHVVTNGFDPDEHVTGSMEFPDHWKACRLNILYTGMIYPVFRDLKPLAQAIQQMNAMDHIQKGDLLVWLFGPNTDVVKPVIEKYRVEPFFKISGSLPHRKALQLQRSADILLFLEWGDGRQKGFFSAKFFEYLGAGKPILGIGPQGGVVDDTLKETGAGTMLNDPILISQALSFFLHNRFFQTQNGVYKPDLKKLHKFTRKYQTQKLARIMKKVATYKELTL